MECPPMPLPAPVKQAMARRLTFVAADAADRSFAIRRRVQAEQLGVRDANPP